MTQKFEFQNVDAFLAPYKTLNELALANVEKLVALQSSNYTKYANMAIDSWKQAAAATDVEKTQAYFEKQAELSKKVVEDVKADVDIVAEIGKAYVTELQSVVAASVKKAA